MGSQLSQLPSILSHLTELEDLNLSYNRKLFQNYLSKANSTSLSSLKKLKRLDLSSCSLKKVPSDIGELVNLEILWLKDNELLNSDFSCLNLLKNLKKIYLSNCGIKELPTDLKSLRDRGVEIVF